MQDHQIFTQGELQRALTTYRSMAAALDAIAAHTPDKADHAALVRSAQLLREMVAECSTMSV